MEKSLVINVIAKSAAMWQSYLRIIWKAKSVILRLAPVPLFAAIFFIKATAFVVSSLRGGSSKQSHSFSSAKKYFHCNRV